jgi:hypothetical protein
LCEESSDGRAPILLFCSRAGRSCRGGSRRQLSRLGRHPLRRAGERQLPHQKPMSLGGFPPSLNAPIWPN